MKIRIKGKFDRNNKSLYTRSEIAQVFWVGDGFVFVEYLEEDIFLEDIFVLEDGTEITLREIQIQFYSKEPLTTMSHGWQCLCRFENLDLSKIPAIKGWDYNPSPVIATRKEQA